MKFSTYEIVGFGISLGLMALALWLIRVETTTIALDQSRTGTENSPIFITEGGNQAALVADAIIDASERGQLTRLVVDDVTIGTGENAVVGNTVAVHYTGRLQSGEVFDSSLERGQPFTFTLGENRVIQGWEQGIIGMKVGGERILVIPPELGYGDRAVGPIPPNATLVFTVELLSIE